MLEKRRRFDRIKGCMQLLPYYARPQLRPLLTDDDYL